MRRCTRTEIEAPADVASVARTALAAAAVAAALAAAACKAGGTDWRVVSLLGGATSIDVVTAPQSVEAFRIDPHPARMGETRAVVGAHPVTAGPVAVDAAGAAELRAVLLDPDTYDFTRAKGCDFTPGVAFRLVKDASRLEIVVCFECDEMSFWRLGRRVGHEDFDAARPRLVALAKRLFPGDAKIQALE